MSLESKLNLNQTNLATNLAGFWWYKIKNETKTKIMKTIAQQLNVKDFPFKIKDKNNNIIYYEDSDGEIIDKRPKPTPEFTMEELIEKLGYEFKIKK